MSGDTGADALNQKLQSLLSSPDSMARIQSLMSSLGGSLPAQESAAAPVSATAKETAATPSAAPAADMSLLTQLAPLLGSMNKEDENTRLLRALRPYLHGEREKRLDDAIHLMQLARLAPLLGKGGPSGKGGD